MTQHMLLMLVGAPLLAFGQPRWCGRGTHDHPRERVAHTFRRRRMLQIWRGLTAPVCVFLLQAVVLWVWHIPSW